MTKLVFLLLLAVAGAVEAQSDADTVAITGVALDSKAGMTATPSARSAPCTWSSLSGLSKQTREAAD